MKKTLLTLSFLLASSAAFAQTLATVNGTKIDKANVDKFVTMIVTQSQGQVSDSPQLRQNILNDLIKRNIVNQEARRLKYDKQKEYIDVIKDIEKQAKETGENKKADYKYRLENTKEDVLYDYYMSQLVKKQKIEPKEIDEAYADFQAFYKGSEEVQLAHLITSNKANVDKAFAELKKGAKFAQVVKKYSEDEKTKNNGGVLPGYINLLDMKSIPMIDNAVHNLKKGTHSDIINLGNGFTIFYVVDKRPAALPERSKIEPMLKEQLIGTKLNQAMAELFKKAKVDYAKP